MKVIYLTNIPSPTRVSFFNELNKYIDLTVLYEKNQVKYRDSSWFNGIDHQYNYVFIKNINDLKLFFDKKYDIRIIGGYSTLIGQITSIFSKISRKKYLLNVDGGLIPENEHLFKKIYKRFFISSADYWLSTGENTDNYLVYYGAIKDKIFHYPFTSVHSVNVLNKPITNEEKTKLKGKLNIPNKYIVLGVGSFDKRKNFNILIKNWNKMPEDIFLLLIGGGPDYIKYKETISSDKIKNVKLIEFTDSNKLKEFYKASNLFVLPTIEDIWGLVINEAMASGLPVVTTKKCVAGKELIQNEINGYLVDSNDFEQFKKAIIDIYNNSSRNYKMQINNLNKIKEYTIENMAKEHYNLFKKIYER